MSELRFPWHAGRTTGRALYDGDGPDDLIGVMDSRELAAVVVVAVNAANAAVCGAQAQESASGADAQDARWRALVGALLGVVRRQPEAHYTFGDVAALVRQAQAALDGTD